MAEGSQQGFHHAGYHGGGLAGDGQFVLAQDGAAVAGIEFLHRGIRRDGNLADFPPP